MKKIILFFLRCIKLLKMQDKLMPELDTIPLRRVKPHHIYQHYGRILVTYRNKEPVFVRFTDYMGSTISEEKYYELYSKNQPCYMNDISGKACENCDIKKLGLPCRCDFSTGVFTGYFKVIHSYKQYSDNPTI